MSELFWSIEARADLRRIDGWLSSNASNGIITRTLMQIGGRSTLLLDYLLSGPRVKDGQRSLHVSGTPYLLVYRPRRAGIEILRIRHIRQDWQPPE